MKIKAIVVLVLAAVLFLPYSQDARAAPIKWSQQPSMDDPALGYSFSSESMVPSKAADDFVCEDESPIIAIRWWGSYWDTFYQGWPYPSYPNSDHWGDPVPNPPGTIKGFQISFYLDVPEGMGVPPWSHPSSMVYSQFIPIEQVTENFYGTINRTASVQTVFEYYAVLPLAFEPTPGTIYWLCIQAIDPDSQTVQWGWQESLDHWNDNAVQMGFSGQGWPDLLADKDLAFELQPVPIPATLLLLGSGLIGLVVRRRRFHG